MSADGPLSGLTFAVKDLFDVAGHVTGCGNPDWAASHTPAERHAWAVQILLDAGVSAIVAPGGSIRDAEVIEACAAAGVALYFTGTRHFAH